MQVKKWLKRLSLGAVVLVVSLGILAFSYERVLRVIAESNYPPEGDFVDVGGHSLHVVAKGNDGPTVVFESGLGIDGHLSWYKVQDEVAQFATTVSYDRAGIIWSERGDNPKTAAAIANELHTMLTNGGFSKPYIIVGHSLAGITLRPYISEHAEDIAGIVLVDTSHPEQMNRMPDEIKALQQSPPRFLMQLLNSFGILRAIYPEVSQNNTAAGDLYNTVVPSMSHKSYVGVLDELAAFEPMLEEVRYISYFGSIPLTVITGTSPHRNDDIPISDDSKTAMNNIWNELQTDLLGLSSNSQHILATESGHYVQIDQPEIVIDAIKDLIATSTYAKRFTF